MRPDLVRLLIDDRRKDLVVREGSNGGVEYTRTIDRVGLSKPLSPPKNSDE
jgi:cyanide hydratase